MTNGTPLQILLVEDSEDDALLLERHLRRSGMLTRLERVDTLEHFREALRARSFDLVLSDYNLPGFDGTAVLNAIRAASLDVPVIIVSGAVGEEVAAELMRSGAADFVRKENLFRLGAAIRREMTEFENRKARQRAESALTETMEALRITNEQLKRAVSARDEFLAAASHELRTPITALKLQYELARRSLARVQSAPPELLRFFRAGEGQIARLITVIESLLDVSRIQTGSLEFHPEWVDVRDIVHAAIERTSEQLRESGNSLEINVSENLTGYWDRARLEQVLMHLLSNASKYAPGVKIQIEGHRLPDGKLRLIVHDFGAGIPKEKQDRIFGRFERLQSVDNISGLGLGLFISRALIQAQGGRIWVESGPSEGSLFIIELPINSIENIA